MGTTDWEVRPAGMYLTQFLSLPPSSVTAVFSQPELSHQGCILRSLLTFHPLPILAEGPAVAQSRDVITGEAGAALKPMDHGWACFLGSRSPAQSLPGAPKSVLGSGEAWAPGDQTLLTGGESPHPFRPVSFSFHEFQLENLLLS